MSLSSSDGNGGAMHSQLSAADSNQVFNAASSSNEPNIPTSRQFLGDDSDGENFLMQLVEERCRLAGVSQDGVSGTAPPPTQEAKANSMVGHAEPTVAEAQQELHDQSDTLFCGVYAVTGSGGSKTSPNIINSSFEAAVADEGGDIEVAKVVDDMFDLKETSEMLNGSTRDFCTSPNEPKTSTLCKHLMRDSEDDNHSFLLKIVQERCSLGEVGTYGFTGTAATATPPNGDVEENPTNGHANGTVPEVPQNLYDQSDSLSPGAYAVSGPGTSERSPNIINGILETEVIYEGLDIESIEVVDEVDVEGQVEEVILGETLRLQSVRSVQSERSSRIGLIFLVLIVSGVALALTLTLFNLRRKSVSDTFREDQQIEKNVLYPPYRDGLRIEYVKGINDSDVASSYYHANAWMLKDPLLKMYSKQRQDQRFAMVYFFFQTNGQNWYQNDHWLSYDISECEWFSRNSSLSIGGWHEGLDPEPNCDWNGNILVMNLSSNNLQGSEPALPGGLNPVILIFDIANNGITGSMPPVAEHSLNMQVFILSNNNFEGLILGGGGMQPFKQRIVKLDGNQLFGYIPLFCHIVPDLEVLNLAGNLFDLVLIPDLRFCRNLTIINVSNNPHRWSIPSELALLPNLKEIDVSGNSMMTGTIPTELGLLPNMTFLGINGTGIGGKIPDSLCIRNGGEAAVDISANCSVIECCV